MFKIYLKISLVSLIILTGFVFNQTYDITSPSIKLINYWQQDNTLGVKFYIVSSNNIKNVKIKATTNEGKIINVYNFTDNCRHAVLKYYLPINKNKHIKLEVTVEDKAKTKIVKKVIDIK